ncbi:MAG: transposase [Bacteroidales bacterium]|nr:transposase [Bacteroidales bacterium]
MINQNRLQFYQKRKVKVYFNFQNQKPNETKEFKMLEKEKERVVNFRYGVIALLSCKDERSLKRKIEDTSNLLVLLPNSTFGTISKGTIEKWYYAYQEEGLDGLVPKERKDKGLNRDIPDDVKIEIDKMLSKQKKYKTSNILRDLKCQENLLQNLPSNSTIYRYVNLVRPRYTNKDKGQERLAFEAPNSGDLWQTDIMYGPYLFTLVDGKYKKCQTYLIAILDDHSRLIVHGEFFLSQKVEDYASTLKQAILKRGIPTKLYCDNGKVFLSSQIKRIAGKLGIMVLHTKVRDAAAKGKIERFFRTVRDKFLQPLYMKGLPKTIEELNSTFWSWLETDYHQCFHTGIQMKPIEKWLLSSPQIRLIPADKEYSSFLFHAERKVRKDGTFSLNGITYETCFTLASKKINIEYDAINNLNVYVSYEKRDYGKATILDKHINNNLPRKNKDINND